VLPPKTTSYRDWARRLEGYGRDPERARDRGFWRRECASAGARLPRTRDGLPAIADVACRSHGVERAETAALTRAAGALGVSIESVIVAALLLAVTEPVAAETMLVYLERHGRGPLFPELDVSRTVGWFTAVFPVAVRVAQGRDPRATLAAVDDHLRALPDGGIPWGMMAYRDDDAPGAADLRALPRPEMSVNFVGRVDPPATSRWRLAAESTGPEHGRRGVRPTIVDLVARIQDERLVIDWHYDARLLAERTIADCLARFARALRDVLPVPRGDRGDGGMVP